METNVTHGEPATWRRAATRSFLLHENRSSFTWNIPYEQHSPTYIEPLFRKMMTKADTINLRQSESPSPRPNMTYEWKGYRSTSDGLERFREQKMRMDAKGLTGPRAERMAAYDIETATTVKRYLDEQKGTVVTTLWTDISPINSQAQERLGYPTQKPLALLERIISASSNEGDVVLDPFCGCGTTIHAAQKLNRQWIGIDVTHLAIALIERRMKDAFPGIAYDVHGVPKDHAGARDLAERDKHEFQKWITATIGAQPYKGGRKGMDRGIDGYLHFRDADRKPQFAIISVKGGATKSGDVRDLKGTMEREKAALGIFLTLNEPTREMEKEAASAGFYETGGMKFPRVQILTAAQVLDNRRPQVPFGFTEATRGQNGRARIGRAACYKPAPARAMMPLHHVRRWVCLPA